ncbi:MAG: pyruvate kinase [Prevotella sp.]|jgi:pyruvate kinase|uniref:pyruvate kinase n=1 Tax=unclassified Dysgonomonas TaxID=2630389 RepID=UPI0025C596BC|nr:MULTISPECIES: pyruvate kinase [unclassified Dysgonomonas]MDR1717153.1 pyruvate kinase [Prevotella sp.]MDR2004512.1 pyruvate kinase [Prevotella sp.]HMM03763.1 pyruvate kinase [Dysgonomonas sp.]
MTQKKTKIVATISDMRCDVDFIKSLYDAGINVVRMNSAHMTEEGFIQVMTNVRAVSPYIGIMMDTKGPEIRTAKNASGEKIIVKTGDKVKVVGDLDFLSTQEQIGVSYPSIVQDVPVGSTLLVDDGETAMKVIDKTADYLLCEIQNDGTIGNRKSVNIPGVSVNLPSITAKDKRSIEIAIENKADFIAHSFVRNKQDVLDVQKILDEYNSPIKIIAKIENQEGVDNIDEIFETAYGVMVARGDLGIEVPQEKIPAIQRLLIRKSIEYKKPVIVATQMLHTMIENPRPTRAEVTDIANAVYYGTDAVMLSGETAYGKYPLEAVRTMAQICATTEQSKLDEKVIPVPFKDEEYDTTSFLAKQAVKAATQLGLAAIITDSYTGRTARTIAAFRSKCPVYAVCCSNEVARQLSVCYGIQASYQESTGFTTHQHKQYFLKALNSMLDKGLVKKEDQVAYLSGSFGEGKGTSFLEINGVGRVVDAGDAFEVPVD